jgi:hypothetical protein
VTLILLFHDRIFRYAHAPKQTGKRTAFAARAGFWIAKLNQAKVEQQIQIGEAAYGSDRRRYDMLDVALVLLSFMKYFVILPVVMLILVRLLWGVWREPAPEAARTPPRA